MHSVDKPDFFQMQTPVGSIVLRAIQLQSGAEQYFVECLNNGALRTRSNYIFLQRAGENWEKYDPSKPGQMQPMDHERDFNQEKYYMRFTEAVIDTTGPIQTELMHDPKKVQVIPTKPPIIKLKFDIYERNSNKKQDKPLVFSIRTNYFPTISGNPEGYIYIYQPMAQSEIFNANQLETLLMPVE